MRTFCISILVSFILLFGGCKNDIELLDNYHSALVCYGLLNPADSVHYVRVSKVFLGEGSALVMAQNQDTISFPIGTVHVTIEEWKNGLQMQNYVLSADTLIPRDSGVFHNPYQVLYRGIFPVLKDGSTYKLKVLDLVKGTSIYAETPIVQDVQMTNPSNNFMPLNFWDTTSIRFKWESGTYGLRYNFKIRFHYSEEFTFDTTQISEHYIDWEVGNIDALEDAGNQSMSMTMRRDYFLKVLAQRIPSNLYVRRISGKIDFIFNAAAQDFATYIDVTNSNNNSTAALPIFTNIHGGYGLFSSRTTTTLRDYNLDSDTRYQLRVNPITYGLNFIR